MFKVLVRIILLFLLSFGLACSSDSSSDGDTDSGGDGSGSQPTSIVLNNPKALFVGSQADAASPSVKSDTEGLSSALFQVLNDDSIEKVSFTDESGNEVDVAVYHIAHISDKFLALQILLNPGGDDIDPPKNVLIEVETGKVYDFTDYVIFTEEGGNYNTPPTIIGDKMYILSGIDNFGDGTMYRISLDTMEAEPMNNPTVTEVTRFYHIADGNFVILDNIYQTLYVLHSDGSTPTQIGGSEYDLLDEMNDLSGGDEDRIDLMYDVKSQIYDFDASVDFTDGIDITYHTFSIDGTGDLVINTTTIIEGTSFVDVDDYMILSSNRLYDKSRVMVFKEGYIFAEPQTDGGFSHDFVAKDLTTLFASNVKDIVWKGTTCFYRNSETDTIFTWDIVNAGSATEFLAENPLDHSIWIIGDYLYFSKAVSATVMETWKIKLDGSGSPIKVSDSNMEIQDIVEFNL